MAELLYPVKEKVFAVGIHRYMFRAGKPAEIKGFKMVKPNEKSESRLCYEVEFSDGYKDWFPISEVDKTFKIITFENILKGEIPKVTE